MNYRLKTLTEAFPPMTSYKSRGSLALLGAILLSSCGAAQAARAVELAILTRENWQEFAPRGKEADCILGDLVLRNDRIVLAIAQPLPTRNANMTVRAVGGMIIDLTERGKPNDQLSAYYAGGGRHAFTSPDQMRVTVDGQAKLLDNAAVATGQTISVEFTSAPAAGKATATLRYTLVEGAAHVVIETTCVNSHDQPVTEELGDSIRADRSFEFGDDAGRLFWAHDDWFRQAYGVLAVDLSIARGEGRALPIGFLADGKPNVEFAPGQSHTHQRWLFPAAHLLGLRSLASELSGAPGQAVSFLVADPIGPTRGAKISLNREGKPYGVGRTTSEGKLQCSLPPGEYSATVSAQGSPEAQVALLVAGPSEFQIQLESPGIVQAVIKGPDDGPIPCKVAFHAQEGGVDPFFGPDSGHTAVQNLVYSHNGRFRQRLAPGKYEAIISHGPEFDAVFQTIEVRAGEVARLTAQLVRSVDTPGWVSADFHSHSSPSGDNTSSQLGRVQNLLAEHIEFAPCTEHNRITTYTGHLKRLQVEHLMATCPGMELTGSPLPINHQNAFPLVARGRLQDGGGPQTDADPEVQIERLALWDKNSEKLVQVNHPNIPQMYGDRDLDGQPDQGFAKMFGFMDVIEVHPPEGIFAPPAEPGEDAGRNPIRHWLQLINLGHRVPGVVNTDAHYNFHGSGWLRNFIKSSTDDPAKIEVAEMVRSSEAGHLVMSNGPFLEVVARSTSGAEAIAGDDLAAPDKKVQLNVRVQCANWLDINRVQVFVNGRPLPELNFTRKTTPDRFSDQVQKFQAELPLSLDRDAHLVVATIGEGLGLGRVVGPNFAKTPPVAVTNPIFVDVDGDGFKPNGDLLDIPFPVKGNPSR